ncbi:MAG: 6-phosphofructokinase [Anaerolineales bacterium]
MRVGILTGGGDVPGLNAAIKAVVNRVVQGEHEVVGIRRGWAGLLKWQVGDLVAEAEYILPLDPQAVRTVDRTGGTFLHTSRTNPANFPVDKAPEFLQADARDDGSADYTEHVLKVIEHLKLDVLIPIGGDDTLSYALRLHDEGLPVIAIPKTMDNDVYGTDYCIGFSTAVTRNVQFIHNLRTSTGSHERIAVVELFGRNSGETSLISAYLSGADRAIISEVPFDPQKLAYLLMADKAANPSNYAMMTISEGAQLEGGEALVSGRADTFGHKKLGGIGAVTGDMLRELTGQKIIYQQVAYLMRSGSPDSLDLMVAMNFGTMASDLALEGKSGRMVALHQGSYTDVPLAETRGRVRNVDVEALYDEDEYRPRVRQVGGLPMFLY